MTRYSLTSSWLALTVGLGVGATAWADADKPANPVPFCSAETETRIFPCRGANLTTVQDSDQLMSIGGGVPPDWMRAQAEPAQGATPEPGATPVDKPADGRKKSAGGKEDGAKKDTKAQRKADRKAQRQADLEREAQEQRAAEQQGEQERKAQEQRAKQELADRERQGQSAKELRDEEERQARRAAKRAERRSTAAASAGGDARPTDVQDEVVSRESLRGSDEEFDTAVAGTGQAAAPAADDDGLSDLGKVLLFGLGAVAVGTLLNNGDEVVANSGDRVVVRRDGDLAVLKNDDALLRRPGDSVRSERFADGSTRETLTRIDGQRIVTVRAADGTVLRRTLIFPNGHEYVLFDDTREVAPVDIDRLPAVRPDPPTAPRSTDDAALRLALAAEARNDSGRRFSLDQVRTIAPVRYLAPEIEVDAVTFATGSAAIAPDQARNLTVLGRELGRLVDRRPETVLLIEGHTDAVGDASYNLALSDRRAESVALALTEYFDIPPENMVIQGYGEQLLKVPTLGAESRNRRAAVRNITALLR